MPPHTHPGQLVLDGNPTNGEALGAVNWSQLPAFKLTELRLSRSKLATGADLAPLTAAKALRTLVVSDTELARSDNYRVEVLLVLPALRSLDGEAVSAEERVAVEAERVRRAEEAAAAAAEAKDKTEADDE